MGKSKPAFFIAARTLSLDSSTLSVGSPTIVKEGRPLPTSTSTETSLPSIPIVVRVFTLDSIIKASQQMFHHQNKETYPNSLLL